MTFFYWPHDRNVQFIKLLKKTPILWDRTNPQYSNRQQRNTMWIKISKELGEPNIQTLKTKVKSFRSNYRAECKKIERDPDYKPVWRYYKTLKFLDKLSDEETEDESEKYTKKTTFHRWSDEKTKRFIQLYKMEPALWSKDHRASTNFRQRELSLGNIAAKLNCSVPLLKIKIKSLRSCFCSERKKMVADKNYQPAWRFFRELTFLDNYGNDTNDSDNDDDDDKDDSDAYNEGFASGRTYYKANSKKPHWEEAKILEFIEFLKISPQLWNRRHPDHKNKTLKNTIWQNMSKEVGMPVAALEVRYKSVRHQFRRHYLKALKDENYVPSWRFFPKLEFLADEMDDFIANIEYLEDEIFYGNTQNSFSDGVECETDNLNEVDVNSNDDNVNNDYIDDDSYDKTTDNESSDDSSKNNVQNPSIFKKTKMVCWSDETTIKFINLLYNQPILWDKEAEFAGNQKKRAEGFKQLALEMGSTLAIIKGKYKRLTSEFRGEYRKMQGQPGYKPIWKFFPYLTFIAGDALPQFESDSSAQERVTRHWDDKKTLEFLSLLEKNPILYSRSTQHNNTYEKDIIWHNIAYELNETVDLVRKQYKALRQKCNVELARKRREPDYMPSWRFYPFAKFLCRAIKDCEEEEEDMAETIEEQNITVEAIKWSDEQIIELIDVLKKYPVIWNKKAPNYKSKLARKKAWQKLSNELCIPEDAIKTKYKTMRSQYNEESKKLAFDADYVPVWRFYKFLKFMYIGREESVKISDSLPVDINKESDMLLNEYDALEETESCSMADYSSAYEQSNDLKLGDTTKVKNIETRPDIQTMQEDVQMYAETESTAHKQPQLSQIQDEYTAFAEYVANEMRKMKGQRMVELSFKSKVIRAVLEANEALKKES